MEGAAGRRGAALDAGAGCDGVPCMNQIIAKTFYGRTIVAEDEYVGCVFKDCHIKVCAAARFYDCEFDNRTIEMPSGLAQVRRWW